MYAIRSYYVPPVSSSGVTFRILPEDRSGSLTISLEASHDFRAGAVKISYSPVASASIEKSTTVNGQNSVTFARGTLPAGLARITVSDMTGTELGSRWYYHETKPDVITSYSIHYTKLYESNIHDLSYRNRRMQPGK